AIDDETPESVVVGLSREFDYEACDRASRHVRSGARFVATNRDPTLPVPGALRPGAGAIVAAIATAAGTEPEVAGKPSATMARVIEARVAVGAVVGDRATTDGALARRLGAPFALVASDAGDGDGDATVRASSLLEAVRALLG
ncbi:MAG TPA: HAD hydrolase-like protein, partial [Acidimicrobiales bacterium]|nr:HAD hydrolase-like protein [Acidimicrobiales bacterium]